MSTYRRAPCRAHPDALALQPEWYRVWKGAGGPRAAPAACPRRPAGRPPAGGERALVGWCLAPGTPGAAEVVGQFDRVRVVAECTCG